jgi:hypothetical protein
VWDHRPVRTDRQAGGDDRDRLAAVLTVVNRGDDESDHVVRAEVDSLFTRDYRKGVRPQLQRLYEKAKHSQWDAETDLPWDTEIDMDEVVRNNAAVRPFTGAGIDLSGTPLERWTEKEWHRYGQESHRWMLSQFLHGEQGALLCTARIVETVPWADAKYYAATQVMDEARHVEVFAKYLDKVGGQYPVNTHLEDLLDDIVRDGRWDVTYLGMQIMVEGLALAAFGFLHQLTTEPLLKQLLRLVMADEARHVAFGVLTLQELYLELSATEIRERQEFAFEAAVRMRDRFLQQEVWERLGVDVPAAVSLIAQSEERRAFQQLLFSKIVPNCKKLGLLDAGDGWLRQRFGELGVLQFEDWPDTADEADVFRLVGEPRPPTG